MSKQACTISRMAPALDLSSDSRRTARNPVQVTGATHVRIAGHKPLVLLVPRKVQATHVGREPQESRGTWGGRSVM